MTTTEKYYKIKSGIEIPSQDTLQVTDSNRPTIRPTLNLNFAQAKVLDPRITFARASTATYYDGKTVTKAEENLLLWSEGFDNAVWNFGTGLVAVSTTATDPLGGSTAEVFTWTSATANRYRFQSVALPLIGTYTLSYWLRAQSGTVDVAMSQRDVGSVPIEVVVTATTTWQRFSRTFTTTISGSALVGFDQRNTGTQDGTVEIWGAQLELRSTATAYTPTTTQPITNYIPTLLTAPANVARFEHNPITGESLGLEIEEQRTNLLTYSENFVDPSWTKLNSVIISNTIIAPDGTLTGAKLVENTANSAHSITKSSNFGATTISVYLKAAERSIVYLYAYPDDPYYATVNLTTLTVNGNGWYPSSSITPVGNGWYRVSIYNLPAWGALKLALTNGTTNSYTGDGYSGVYIWGFQSELGAFPTSYIKTEASQVTRAADNASMTGTNFSSWYRADEGSFYAEANTSRPTGGVAIATAYFSNSQGIELLALSNVAQFNAVVNGSYTARTDLGTISPNTTFKIAGGYKFNDFAGSLDGAAVVVDTSGNVPSATQPTTLYIGGYATFPNVSWSLTGTIKKLTYYPARITNAQLQSITS